MKFYVKSVYNSIEFEEEDSMVFESLVKMFRGKFNGEVVDSVLGCCNS